MIFTDTTELRGYVNVSEGLNFEVIKPDIERTEKQILKRFLGAEQYDELVAEFELNIEDISGMEGRLQDLLYMAREAVALLSVGRAADILQVQISDSGIQMVSSAEYKQAFAWMKHDAKSYLMQYGYAAIDQILSYMEANVDDFPLWAESSAYTLNKQFLVNSAADFQQYYNINESRLTYLALQSTMRRVEAFNIAPQIGAAFFAEIKAQIASNALSEDNQLLMQWLAPACALYTMERGYLELPLLLTESGVVLNFTKAFQGDNNKESQPVDHQRLLVQQRVCKTDADTYMKLCLDYLRANASETRYETFYTSALKTASENSPYTNDPTNKIVGFF